MRSDETESYGSVWWMGYRCRFCKILIHLLCYNMRYVSYGSINHFRIGFLGSLGKVWSIPVYPDITYNSYSRDHPGIWLQAISRSSHGSLAGKMAYRPDSPTDQPTKQPNKQPTDQTKPTSGFFNDVFRVSPKFSSHVSLCQGTVKILKSLTNSICPFTILVPMFKAYSYRSMWMSQFPSENWSSQDWN